MAQGIFLANRYRLLEQIDSGGSSFIYKAIDSKNNSVVAIKILKPELIHNSEFVDRFKKEVQAALRLKHANIIRAYDAGKDGDMYYIVMDYINGKTLKHIITINKQLPVQFVVNVAKKICLALEYAHVKGFVHRDIKPQNIMIDMDGEPYIADFGIAKKITPDANAPEDENVMGSVHYFSPEQARGEKVDKRTDIYSIGIMLYEMLAGKVPFEGDTSVEIALQHLNQPIPDVCSINSDVPPSLGKIIMKAAQKEKEARYKSAFSMYEDLNKCLAEKSGSYIKLSVQQPMEPTEGTTVKNTQKGIRTILFSALGIVAAIVVLLLVFNQNFESNAASIIVPDVVNMTEQTAEGTMLASNLDPFIAYSFSTEIANGVVISQDPLAGTEVKAGQRVTVTVSAGPERPHMPDVVGLPLEDALELLKKQNIENVEIIEQSDGEYVDGNVIDQVPAKNDAIVSDEKITLTVKKSSDQLTQRAPDVMKLPLTMALETLKSTGFTKFYIYEEEDELSNGFVVDQTPAQGVSQKVELPFTLWISEYDEVYSVNKSMDIEVMDDNTYVSVALKTQLNGTDVYFILYEAVENAGTLRLDISDQVGLPFSEESLQAQLVVMINDVAEQSMDVVIQSGG